MAVQGACVAGILLMGVARIELGAHWPTDVIGGYLLAILMLIPMVALHRRLEARASAAI
jgi:undecaprenyl-diphosphatase